MYLLGLAFIAWIACGGLVMGYFVDRSDQIDMEIAALRDQGNSLTRMAWRDQDQINRVEIMAHDADKAAKAAQASIDAHERWVEDQRRQNAAVIEKHRRAARGHNG